MSFTNIYTQENNAKFIGLFQLYVSFSIPFLLNGISTKIHNNMLLLVMYNFKTIKHTLLLCRQKLLFYQSPIHYTNVNTATVNKPNWYKIYSNVLKYVVLLLLSLKIFGGRRRVNNMRIWYWWSKNTYQINSLFQYELEV